MHILLQLLFRLVIFPRSTMVKHWSHKDVPLEKLRELLGYRCCCYYYYYYFFFSFMP